MIRNIFFCMCLCHCAIAWFLAWFYAKNDMLDDMGSLYKINLVVCIIIVLSV